MPSTNEATLQLIQQEISEVVQRERELKEKYANLETKAVSVNGVNGTKEAKLEHQVSVSPVTNGKANSRLFTPNPTTKGVMQRFIKSKGKLTKLATATNSVTTPAPTFVSLDFVESSTPIILTGSSSRNGFVPINERIKREFVEMEKREVELRLERRKSQSDLIALYDPDSPEFETRSLQTSRSISQMSDCDSLKGSSSSPSLKQAKSLADLCDLNGEELQSPPSSHSLIKQWELLIQKNQVRP